MSLVKKRRLPVPCIFTTRSLRPARVVTRNPRESGANLRVHLGRRWWGGPTQGNHQALAKLPSLTIAACAVALLPFQAFSQQIESSPLSGSWTGTWGSYSADAAGTISATLVQSDDDITGTLTVTGSECFSNGTVTGTVDGRALSLGGAFSQGTSVNFSGQIDLTNTIISGEYFVSTGDCAGDTGSFVLQKSTASTTIPPPVTTISTTTLPPTTTLLPSTTTTILTSTTTLPTTTTTVPTTTTSPTTTTTVPTTTTLPTATTTTTSTTTTITMNATAAVGGPQSNPNRVFDQERGPGCPGMPLLMVDTTNLNLVIRDTDFSYSGRGPDVHITRTYNAAGTHNGVFGNKWTFNYDVGLRAVGNGIVELRRPSGKLDRFTPGGSGAYNSPKGVYDVLTRSGDGTFELLLKESKIKQQFDGFGRLTSLVDRNGNRVTLSYTSGRPAAITDASGRATLLTYNGLGRVSRLTDPAGRVAQFFYDSSGNLTRTTDMAGNTVYYTYDAEGHITAITTPRGTTTFTHAAANEGYALASVTNPDGIIKRYTRIPSQRKVVLTDGNGWETIFLSTEEGYTATITDALGRQTSAGYTNGNRTRVTDANGRTTTLTYDTRGNLIGVLTPLGRTVNLSYDANDNLTRLTGPMGNSISFTYNSNHNLTAVSDPPTVLAYNSQGEVTSVTDAKGNTTTLSYDSAGNIVSIIDPAGAIFSSQTYDAVGRLTGVMDPSQNGINYKYDGIDRVTEIRSPVGAQTIGYNCCGVSSETDEEGRTYRFSYEATDGLTFQNLAGVIDPLGKPTTYSYDGAGNLISATHAHGFSVDFRYDPSGRLVEDADGVYAYDLAGNVTFRTDRNGNTVSYSYDPDNRLTGIGYPDGDRVTLGYDGANNLTRIQDSAGLTRYVYSFVAGADRVVSKTDPFGNTVGYGYDSVGNPTHITYPDGKVVSYGYDALNRLVTVTDWLGNTVHYTYVYADRVGSIAYPNGATTTIQYDSRWQVSSLIHRKSDGAIISSYTYTLDKSGRRIAEEKVETAVGDPFSLSTDFTFNANNQLISSSGESSISFAYDNNGNLIRKQAPDELITYTYDFENRIKQRTAGENTTSYVYDGLGRRIARTSAGGTTRYVLSTHTDLSQILAETDTGGQITAYYVYGAGLSHKITPTGTSYYYHYDGVGSTVALTDSSQRIVNRYAYDSDGRILGSEEGVANPFKFVGQLGVMHEGNDLYFMRARFYDADIARFLQKDPISGTIWDPQSLNRYPYSRNDPMNFVDPNGLFFGVLAKWAVGGTAKGLFRNGLDLKKKFPNSPRLRRLVEAGIAGLVVGAAWSVLPVASPAIITTTLLTVGVQGLLESFGVGQVVETWVEDRLNGTTREPDYYGKLVDKGFYESPVFNLVAPPFKEVGETIGRHRVCTFP